MPLDKMHVYTTTVSGSPKFPHNNIENLGPGGDHMRRVKVLVPRLLLLAGLMVGVNGQAFGETDTEMIVGGTAAPDGKYPW